MQWLAIYVSGRCPIWFSHQYFLFAIFQIRLSSETKAILNQHPNTRTPEQVQTVRRIDVGDVEDITSQNDLFIESLFLPAKLEKPMKAAHVFIHLFSLLLYRILFIFRHIDMYTCPIPSYIQYLRIMHNTYSLYDFRFFEVCTLFLPL